MLECLQVMQNQLIVSNTVSERLSGGMGCARAQGRVWRDKSGTITILLLTQPASRALHVLDQLVVCSDSLWSRGLRRRCISSSL